MILRCAIPLLLMAAVGSGATLTLRNGKAAVSIDPVLRVEQSSSGSTVRLLTGGPARPSRVRYQRRSTAEWEFSAEAVRVDATLGAEGLRLVFRSTREQEFRLAVAGAGMAKALIGGVMEAPGKRAAGFHTCVCDRLRFP